MTLNDALLILLSVSILVIAWLANNWQIEIARCHWAERCLEFTKDEHGIEIWIGKVLITLYKEERK